MNDVLIIAVIYNTYEETLRFVKSIALQQTEGIKIILVDNSEKPTDAPFENKLNEINLNITYLKSKNNLGYFGGANYGLQHFLQSNLLPQWIIVSNVDIVLEQKDFFKKLFDVSVSADIGVIAPSIISHRWQADTNPKIVERYSKQQMDFFLKVCKNAFTQNAYMTLSYLKKSINKFKHKPNESLVNARRKIYAPHGSCLIFNKIYFEKGGNLNHISFLFGEEIFVAETLLKLKLEAWYEPDLVVSDYEHASTGFFYSNKVAGYMKQSTIDIIANYYTVK